MDKTIGALRNIFLLLYHAQKSDWKMERKKGRRVSQKAVETKNWLQLNFWPPIEELDLERSLRGPDELTIDFSKKKRVLYLPLLEKDAEYVPVLSLICDLGKDKSKSMMKLSIMLVSMDDATQKPYGIGFRIESPHSEEYDEEKEGRHDFHHAQFINDLGLEKKVDSPERLPCTQPSFPLTADDPITLVFSLLITLYGKNYCLDFYKDHSELQYLKPHMKKMNEWIKWKEF